MTTSDLDERQKAALDALIAAAVDLGGATNEHVHRASLNRLKDAVGSFLFCFDPPLTTRTLSQAINASYESALS